MNSRHFKEAKFPRASCCVDTSEMEISSFRCVWILFKSYFDDLNTEIGNLKWKNLNVFYTSVYRLEKISLSLLLIPTIEIYAVIFLI